MAWTLHLLVWITITASAYKCMHTSYTSSDSDSRHYYDYARQKPIGIPDNRAYERTNTRSANISPASYSPNVPDDIKSAKLRIVDQTPTRTESESKVLSWKPYAESRRGQNNDKIVFPGPTSTTTSDEFDLEIPEHSKPLGFIDEPNNLKAQAEKVIEEISGQGKFQEDLLDLPDVPDITQRLSSDEKNIELCGFHEMFAYPKAAVDSKGNWYIELKYTPYNQRTQDGFRVEICNNVSTKDKKSSELQINEGEWEAQPRCANFVKFIGDREGRCEQKFVSLKITVEGPDGTQLVRTIEKVASHCQCVARHTNSNRDYGSHD